MLQTIREYTQGWIASVIIGLIILSFALWGIHSYIVGGNNNVTVAEVNGVGITKDQLASAYERMRRQFGQYGSGKEAELKKQALNSLIDMEILQQASVQQGYRVYDSQVDGYIQGIPDFQVNGRFSVERFQQLLASSMLSTNEFIGLIRTSLLIEQPKIGITSSSFALPNEAADTIELVNQERDIAYLNIPVEYVLTTQPPQITPAQIQAYYNEHQKEFMTPEQVTVEYVQLSFKDMPGLINPTDAVLKSFYSENANTFQSQAFETVKDKVKELYVRQHADEKFAETRDQMADLAYQHPDSLDAVTKELHLPVLTSVAFSRDKGGSDISQNKKIRDIAFSNDVLNMHNNSDVIQLNSETLVVLRIKSHSKPRLIPLNEVSKTIEDKLKLTQAENQTAKLAEELKAKLVSGQNSLSLPTVGNSTWMQAGFIGRNSTKVDSAVLDLAFRLPDPSRSGNKPVYGVAKLVNGYAVVELKSVKKGSVSDEKQKAIFMDQVQNSNGTLEYELYKKSEIAAAKVKKFD